MTSNISRIHKTNIKKQGREPFFTSFIWQYQGIFLTFTKTFYKNMRSNPPQESTIYTLFIDRKRAGLVGLYSRPYSYVLINDLL